MRSVMILYAMTILTVIIIVNIPVELAFIWVVINLLVLTILVRRTL